MKNDRPLNADFNYWRSRLSEKRAPHNTLDASEYLEARRPNFFNVIKNIRESKVSIVFF